MKVWKIKRTARLILVLIILFFTTQGIFPSITFSAFTATTTDSINITLTVNAVEAPPTPPTGGGGGGPPGTPSTVQIIDVETITSTSTATVFWKTTRQAVSIFSWGTTTEYTLGTFSELDLSLDHLSFLENLIPDTQYFFFIEVDDFTTGKQGYVGTFNTLPLPDIKPPTNIINLQAIGTEDAVDLKWSNPPDEDFDLVRIVRSEEFFPASPYDGKVVYEGRGESTRDTDVNFGTTYFYSAFAFDKTGNYSEGSIAIGRLVSKGIPPEIIKEPFEEFPPSPEIHPLLEELNLFHIDFIQDGKKIPHINNRVLIDGSKELIISIDYELLPEILKTIGFTIQDPEDSEKTFSFLLRVTDDKSTYRTTLAPFGKGGLYAFDVNILDHKNQGIKKLDGTLLAAAVIEEIEVVETVGKLLKELIEQRFCFLFILLLLLLLMFITVIKFIRKRSKEQTQRKQLSILFFLLLIAFVTIVFFKDSIPEQYFCLLLWILLLLLLSYSIYKLFKRFLVKKITKEENLLSEENKYN